MEAGESFAIRGTILRFRFNQPMAGASAGAPAGGKVLLQPDVPGIARWADPTTLEFTAAAPLDPKTRYNVELAALESASGQALSKPFRASFTATPVVIVAGKELGYLPTPGEPRVVTIRPDVGITVGKDVRFVALYDQAVDLSTVRELVTLNEGVGGPAVPIALKHPAKDELEGEKVDRRFVVLAQPTRPLRRGESLHFEVRDLKPAPNRNPSAADVKVAAALGETGVECNWYNAERETCVYSGGTLRMSGRSVHVRFNNPIATEPKRLPGHVNITPPVRNLSVSNEGWDDGRLVLTGDFRPPRPTL